MDIIYNSDFGKWNKPYLTISDRDLVLLEDAFAFLQKKAGITIDLYAGCPVYVSHQKILVHFLSDSPQKGHPVVAEFIMFLRQAIADNETLLFDGD